MIKSNPCKECGSIYHTKMYHKPRKPIKTSPKKPKVVKRVVKRKKAETRSQLVKKLDAVYSQYIRLMNSDDEGYCICVTSGERIYWKEIQNGHFFSRKYLPTRWNDDNCHPQSLRDNVFLRGNYINYTRYMIDRYGREFVDELEKTAKSQEKIPTPVLREKLLHYSTEVKRLKSIKGLT